MPLQETQKRNNLAWLALFTSMTTLVCCALPILLVSLGLGATYAAMTDSAPWLITLGKYKAVTFFVAGILISGAAWFIWRPGRACPTDPILAVQCQRVDKWNKRALVLAISAWLIGFFAAYLAFPLQVWLEN